MPSLSHKRGTRAQVDAAAAANALRVGEVYLITDEARLTVGTSASTHQPAAKQGEGGGDPWTWIKLGADVANNTVTSAAATGLSFTAAANTMYLVELIGTFQSAIATTGIAVALDIPSGTVAGMAVHQSNATTLTGTVAAALPAYSWIVVPPTGATPFSVSVAVEFNPPTTVAGFKPTDTTEMAVTVIFAETLTPAAEA